MSSSLIESQQFPHLRDLKNYLKEHSLKTGQEFILASGEKSNVYIDLKKTILSGRIHKLLAKLLLDEIYGAWNVARLGAVAGVALGGCHLASIVAIHASVPLDVIYVRKAAKDHGTKQLIEKPDVMIDGGVILLEDVMTTGNSALKAIEELEKEGLDVVGVITVVDRRQNREPVISNGLGTWPLASLVDFEELL